MKTTKTIEEIEGYLRSRKVSGVMAVRFRNLASSFATVDAFFSAKREDIEKMYNRLTPDGHKGIGGRFWPVFNMALDFYNGRCEEEKKETVSEPEQEQPVDKREVEMITYDTLKKIVDMMELLDVEAINLMEISGFLRNVRFRQKKAVADAPAAENSDGSGSSNAKQA